MGKNTEASIQAIQALIKSNEPHGLQPEAPTTDVPAIPAEKLTMSDPPNYKLGDKVSWQK